MPSARVLGGVSPQNRETAGVKTRLYGVFRGVVEYVKDPMRRGRCKVRIPAIHGTEESIETKHLPWAEIAHIGGGALDHGSYVTYTVGATVLVLFENGLATKPIIIGSWYKEPLEDRELNTKTSAKSKKKVPDGDQPISMGTWMQVPGLETPKETLVTPYHDPTVKVIYKSPKGATIVIEDRDSYENIKVIDRAGQELVLSSPVNEDDNEGNAQQRGLREARKGEGIPYQALAGDFASVELIGLTGQGLRMITAPNSEWVELSAIDQSQPVSPNRSDNRAALRLSNGSIEITGVSNKEETFSLRIDLATGTVDLVSSARMSISAESLTITADRTTVEGDMTVDGDLSVRGDLVANKEIM